MTELLHHNQLGKKTFLIVKSVTSIQSVANDFSMISGIWILKLAQFHRGA